MAKRKDKNNYFQKDLFSDTLEEKKKHAEEPKRVQKPVPRPEQKINAWVPQMINGEWEIY